MQEILDTKSLSIPRVVLRTIVGNNLLVLPYEQKESCILRLNNKAVHIWKALESGQSDSEIMSSLTSNRSSNAQVRTAIHDTIQFYRTLQHGKSIQLHNSTNRETQRVLIKGDLSAIYLEAKEKYAPIFGGIELTWRCNLKCCHCYIRDNKARLLDASVWFKILDSLAEGGCLHLAITGGESLQHPHFLEIYTYAKSKGFLITLFTNATLITPEIVKTLVAYPPYQIDISIYGSTRKVYEAVTNKTGSFTQFLHGLQLLEDADLPYRLKTILLTINYGNKEEIESFFARKGQPFLVSSVILPRLDGKRGPEEFRLSSDTVVSLEMNNDNKCDIWSQYFDSRHSVRSNSLFNCSAGRTAFQVDNLGRLSLCIMYRYPLVPLTIQPFSEAWRKLRVEREREFASDSLCSNCGFRVTCDQCPGWALLETGNEEAPVPYLCSIAYNRYSSLEAHKSKNGGNQRWKRRRVYKKP